jgi:hypothetical protein
MKAVTAPRVHGCASIGAHRTSCFLERRCEAARKSRRANSRQPDRNRTIARARKAMCEQPRLGEAHVACMTVMCELPFARARGSFSTGRASDGPAETRTLGRSARNNRAMAGVQYNMPIDTDAQGRPRACRRASVLGRRSFSR